MNKRTKHSEVRHAHNAHYTHNCTNYNTKCKYLGETSIDIHNNTWIHLGPENCWNQHTAANTNYFYVNRYYAEKTNYDKSN